MKNIIDFNATFEKIKNKIMNGFTKIPSSIRYDKNVNDTAKILYAILVMLNNTYEYVYVSNDYLSSLLNLPNTTLRENLYKLKSLKYIEIRDNDLNRYIRVRKDDLTPYQIKSDIDVSSLDQETLSNYYSLIPGYVLLSENLNFKEKMIYAEIMALTNKFGFAFISNKKLADLMDLSERQLIRSLNNLIKYHFIQYGKDIKSKRLIYVNYHYKKHFQALNKSVFNYEVIENENNDVITVKRIFNHKTEIPDHIDNMLDEIYKKI